MRAAQAHAETAKVPVVTIDDRRRPRAHPGLFIAAGIVVIGAAALTVGVVSTRSTGSVPAAESDKIAQVASLESADDDPAPRAAVATDIAVVTSEAGEALLALRLHAEVATSLPRIQAVTATDMREGSGLFVTHEGHIATSAGLVADAEYVVVWTEDGRRWKAHVLATDPFSDVAVLQIESDEWPAVALGTGTDLWSGQYALAIDHADRTISVGEVTDVEASRVVVDQPAALPGSAIVDDTGAVIAMVNHQSNELATPAWLLEQVAVDLISSGWTTHTWLGITLDDSPDGQMAMIVDVVADSPAAAAGLRPGDLIDSINGETVADAATLWRLIQTSEPGDDAVLTVTRHGSRRIIVATLKELAD